MPYQVVAAKACCARRLRICSNGWGRTYDLLFVPEHTINTPRKNCIYLDGALLHALRVPFGYWEAKDADDNLDAEIAAKTRKG